MSKKKRARRAATQKMQRNGTTVSARELESKERQQPPPQNVDIDESIERLIDRSLRKRIAWLRRPRLDTAFFEEVCNDEQLAKVNHFVPEAPERARQIREASKNLGWSSERISLFKELAVEYRQRPSIENYLKVRHLFPDVEILLDRLVGPESFFALEKHFEKQGVDPELVAAGTLDADEPGVDALSLRLLECLVAGDDIEKGRPGYIDRRRNAISDTTVGYIGAESWSGSRRPSSF